MESKVESKKILKRPAKQLYNIKNEKKKARITYIWKGLPETDNFSINCTKQIITVYLYHFITVSVV